MYTTWRHKVRGTKYDQRMCYEDKTEGLQYDTTFVDDGFKQA